MQIPYDAPCIFSYNMVLFSSLLAVWIKFQIESLWRNNLEPCHLILFLFLSGLDIFIVRVYIGRICYAQRAYSGVSKSSLLPHCQGHFYARLTS